MVYGSITGVPAGTSQADFLAALIPGGPGQTMMLGPVRDPVGNLDVLNVYSEDGTRSATYRISVVADLSAYNAALSAVHSEPNYYTSASWAAYQAVVAANVVTDSDTQARVDDATRLILKAQLRLNVRNTVPPVIRLIGDNPVHVAYAATYDDPGVSVTDDRDTNVAVFRTITDPSGALGSINTGHAGTYTIHYNATDSAGNKAIEVTRTVIVAQPSHVATVSSSVDDFQVTRLTNVRGYIYISIANSVQRQVFLNGLLADGPGQAWDKSGLSQMVHNGNTLTVTAQDGVTKVTYIVSVRGANNE